MLLCGAPAFGQGPAVVADEGRLWVMVPEPERPGVFTLLHHGPDDPANRLSRVTTLRGEIDPHGVAARGNALWMIYTDGTIRSIHAEPTPLKDGWVYQRRVEHSLPEGVSVRAVMVTDTGPWVLVRIDELQALEAIQTTAKPKDLVEFGDQARRRRNIVLGLPPGYQSSKNTSAAQPVDSKQTPPTQAIDQSNEPEDSGSVSFPVDRLLCFEHGQWRIDALPADWAHAAQAWLVTDRPKAKRPTLITMTRDENDQASMKVEVYRRQTAEDPSWEQQSYSTQFQALDAGFELVSVENQLVLAELGSEDPLKTASLSVLRDGKVLPVGRMSMKVTDSKALSILGFSNTAAWITQSVPSDRKETSPLRYGLTWTRMDLRGNLLLEPTDLTVVTRGPMDDIAQYAELLFFVVLSSVLILAFWRRDSDWNRLELPENLVVADLGRRVMAAAIDLAPGLLLVMFYFGLSIDDLIYRHWPGNWLVKSFQQMLPGLLVIAIFVSHTTVSELIFARTFGKTITGLRTTKLDGTRPRFWQLLVRGLIKTLDLLPFALLLLILPVIAPHRQRLGDLVARTVVVTDAPKEEPEEEGDQDDSNDLA